jgi:hypothetical protein
MKMSFLSVADRVSYLLITIGACYLVWLIADVAHFIATHPAVR